MTPYQVLTKQPTFCFKVCPQAILKVPLTNGKNVLFNARLFTHRQDNTGVNNLRLTNTNIHKFYQSRAFAVVVGHALASSTDMHFELGPSDNCHLFKCYNV